MEVRQLGDVPLRNKADTAGVPSAVRATTAAALLSAIGSTSGARVFAVPFAAALWHATTLHTGADVFCAADIPCTANVLVAANLYASAGLQLASGFTAPRVCRTGRADAGTLRTRHRQPRTFCTCGSRRVIPKLSDRP